MLVRTTVLACLLGSSVAFVPMNNAHTASIRMNALPESDGEILPTPSMDDRRSFVSKVR